MNVGFNKILIKSVRKHNSHSIVQETQYQGTVISVPCFPQSQGHQSKVN